ncbi:MAG: glucose-6-phosphate dehydrogenase [Lentisphaeria bacterium]
MMLNKNVEWRENLCVEHNPGSCVFVIFGASGDLAKRKLFPSLFALYMRDLLGKRTRIIGCARHAYSDDGFRKYLLDAFPNAEQKKVEDFLQLVFYQVVDYSKSETYQALTERIPEFTKVDGKNLPCLFYLAVPSLLYINIVQHLTEHGLLQEDKGAPKSWRHIVFEKPFGHDLKSAIELEESLGQYIKESQIYRIDHYLGKETVQNIFLLRFANLIFEPIWNSQYIDNVQITVAETLGVEKRAGYFDQSGLLRDMFQNHMLEMLSLVAMECPSVFSADEVRDEKLKLIRSIRPLVFTGSCCNTVRGQYEGYLSEPEIPADSQTETFVALKMFVDNWRWHGVPFYLRAGKKMAERKSEIVITFKPVPYSIFPQISAENLQRDILRLRVQPEEGMGLTIQAKKAGPKLCMGALTLNYDYEKSNEIPLDAYARLLLDCRIGDQTLFIRNDIIRASWELYQPLLDFWKNNTTSKCPLNSYVPGSTGPDAASQLLRRDQKSWL